MVIYLLYFREKVFGLI